MLIKSISGIRGTIGGRVGEGLSPIDVVKFTTAYAEWTKNDNKHIKCTVVVGRDARISGQMIENLVVGTLMGSGIDVINIGLATTPTTEIAVTESKAQGGIIITASHNPKQWNALKLLNNKGEFLSAKNGEQILEIAENIENKINFAEVGEIGNHVKNDSFLKRHVEMILDLELVDIELIRHASFSVAVDCINSVGAVSVPYLFEQLGVKTVHELNCTPDGNFAHNPEPLAENLVDLCQTVANKKADVGFAVDPDVDRLAIVNEDGTLFGEEYTLVAVADYILFNKKGNTVSNLSSTKALRDITEQVGQQYFASAVGEVNVVNQMKKQNAIIGGEGNGGVIYPELHYGRDSLVGIALFLTHLAKSKLKCSQLRAKYPNYYISKNKIVLKPTDDVDAVLAKIKVIYEKQNVKINTIDGIKIDFENEWVHLRKSNTEPIIRIYSESENKEKADKLAQEIMKIC